MEKRIKDKNKRFKELMACTEEEDRIKNSVSYKEAKRAAKKEVTEAKKTVVMRTCIGSLIPKRGRNRFLSWRGLGPNSGKP